MNNGADYKLIHRTLTKLLKELNQLALKRAKSIQNEEVLVLEHLMSRKQAERTNSPKHVTSCGLRIII